MISLELSRDIYSMDNIKCVIRVYSDYARIKLNENDERYILEFSDCKYDGNTTVREFENYLIGMENI